MSGSWDFLKSTADLQQLARPGALEELEQCADELKKRGYAEQAIQTLLLGKLIVRTMETVNQHITELAPAWEAIALLLSYDIGEEQLDDYITGRFKRR